MQVKIFNNPDFGEIRVSVTEDGEPLFCAADVCKALGYSNGRDAIAKHVEVGDVAKCDTPTVSGVQTMTFVNESGLYSLIFGSKLDGAKVFKRWVTSEVLPSIRKTGKYAVSLSPAEQLLANAQLLVEMERRQSRIETEVKQIQNRMDENGFMSVMGYANINHLNIGKAAAQSIGRYASKWCKRHSVTPEKVRHERYGEVNTYPRAALKQSFREFFPNIDFI